MQPDVLIMLKCGSEPPPYKKPSTQGLIPPMAPSKDSPRPFPTPRAVTHLSAHGQSTELSQQPALKCHACRSLRQVGVSFVPAFHAQISHHPLKDSQLLEFRPSFRLSTAQIIFNWDHKHTVCLHPAPARDSSRCGLITVECERIRGEVAGRDPRGSTSSSPRGIEMNSTLCSLPGFLQYPQHTRRCIRTTLLTT